MSTHIVASNASDPSNPKPIFLEIDGVLYEISEQHVAMDTAEIQGEEASQVRLSSLNAAGNGVIVTSKDTSLVPSNLQQSIAVEQMPSTSNIFHTNEVVLSNEVLKAKTDHGYHSQPVPGPSEPSDNGSQDLCTVIEVPLVDENHDQDLMAIATGLANADDLGTYQIIQNGTRQGRPLLADSMGYTYTVKRVTKSKTYWHCPSRDKSHNCPARITQDEKGFHPHTVPHDHAVHPETGMICKIMSQARTEAVLPENTGKSASAILRQVLMKFPEQVKESPLFKKNNLERMINRERQVNRDKPSTGLWTASTSDIDEPIENHSSDMRTMLSAAELASSDEPVGYEILYNVYLKGLPLLVTTQGHAYTVMKQVGDLRYWQCPRMRHGLQCPSIILEQDGKFVEDQAEHNHHPDPERQLRRKVKSEVWKMLANFRKQNIQSDLMIEEVLAEVIQKNPQFSSLLDNLRKWSIKYVPKIMEEYHASSTKRSQQSLSMSCANKGQMALVQQYQESRVWPEYEILQHGTVRAQPLLINRHGNCFAVKRGYNNKFRKYWHCSSRSRPHFCQAAISEKNGQFIPNHASHTHALPPGQAVLKRITNQVHILLASAPTCYSDADLLVEQATHRITGGVIDIPLQRVQQWRKMVQRIQDKIAQGGQGPSYVFSVIAEENANASLDDYEDEDGVDDDVDADDFAMETEVSIGSPVEGDQSDSPEGDKCPDEVQVKIEPEDPVDQDTLEEDAEILYTRFPTGSKYKTPLLVDSLGYTYTQRLRKKVGKIRWICSVRSDNLYCPAFVNENKGEYTRSLSKHRHAGNLNKFKQHFVSKAGSKKSGHSPLKCTPSPKRTKATKTEDTSDAAGLPVTAAETVAMETQADDSSEVASQVASLSPIKSSPSPSVITKTLNAAAIAQKDSKSCKNLVTMLQSRLKAEKEAEKKKAVREEPTNLEFELHMSSIPDGFLKKDVRVGDQRHIILATEVQVAALQSAKLLYVDCTTRLIIEPFTKLVTIQAWMNTTTCELVPLAHILMSSSRKKDYKKVLNVIRQMISESLPIKRITASYELPLWQALWSVFPDIPVYGCAYHWTQDVWDKIVELGLQPLFRKQGPTYNYLRKVLALPFLPQPHIPTMFTALEAQAGGKQLEELMAYIDINWITNTVWSIAAWSTYKRVFRTRQQIDAYLPHARPNHKLPFYILIRELHSMARQVSPPLATLSHKKVYSHQRDQTSLQGLIIAEWDCYLAGKCTATVLLNLCSDHCPAML